MFTETRRRWAQFGKSFLCAVSFAVLTLCASSHAGATDIVVIENSANPEQALSIDQLRRLFLAQDHFFPDENHAVNRVDNAKLAEEFYQKLVHRNGEQMRAYWAGLVFTGRGNLAQVLEGDDLVIEFVMKNEWAIGYVSRSSVKKGVKTVQELP